jgi:broad specificity phosphatase PhoE
MIILIRHAQSEGNKNREIHQSVPDHRVKLTPEGHKQALEAGRRLRDLLRPDDTLHFFTSPYRRTRETTEKILESLTSDEPSPSPFPRHTIKVYEEPRLREQDFGNFQPCSAEMSRMWQERADYGHFFYRIPNGESAADAYDRVSGFNESLWRLFGEDSFASVCVLVTHGLMTRVFLMKWYHFSVEYFEDLRNVNHCEFVIMEKNPDNGKFVLQNNLRTWSALRQEKEEERKRERVAKGLPPAPPETDIIPPVRRKWGGCPDGCTHDHTVKPTSWRPARQDKADLFRDDDGDETTDGRNRSPSTERKRPLVKHATHQSRSKTNNNHRHHSHDFSADPSIDDVISSPAQTPSYISLASVTRSVPEVSVSTADNNNNNNNNNNNSSSKDQPQGRMSRKSSKRDGRSSISPLRLSSSNSNHNNNNNTDTEGDPSLPNIHLLRLGGRDGGGSTSGVDSPAPSDSEEVDSSLPDASRSLPAVSSSTTTSSSHPHSIQDAEDDGDDEGAGSRRTVRRHKSSHHHHHNTTTTTTNTAATTHDRTHALPLQQQQSKANALGDADSASSDEDGGLQADNEEDEDDHASNSEIDRLRNQEESVSESVY